MKSWPVVLGFALVVGWCGNLEARNRRCCHHYDDCYRQTTVNNNYVVVKHHHHHDGVRLAANIVGLVGNSINLLNNLNPPPVVQPTVIQPTVVTAPVVAPPVIQPTVIQPTVIQPTVVYPNRVIVRPRCRTYYRCPGVPCRRAVYFY